MGVKSIEKALYRYETRPYNCVRRGWLYAAADCETDRRYFMENIKQVILNDKWEVHLDDEDEDALSLNVICDGETECILPVSNPSGCYGGGSLSLSSSGGYLLFSFYSGQSEEAFMLFTINTASETGLAAERLKLVYESGYLYGEAASYGFSSDEKLLLQGLPTLCTDWREAYAEEPETDSEGNHFFIFGAINVLDIEENTFSEHIIHIYPSDDWGEHAGYYDSFMSPEMINGSTLKVTMPWGDETFMFPLNEIIVIN